MTTPRILVAGIGNIFQGDDAFGSEVARRLAGRVPPEGVRVVDFGIRGLDLTYALLDPYEAVILIDAAPRGGRPGTLSVLELAAAGPDGAETAGPSIEGHNLDPLRALRLAAAMGGPTARVLLVGCEPEAADAAEEFRVGLSEPVRAALEEAIVLVDSLVARLLRGEAIDDSRSGDLSGKEVRSC